MQRIIYTADIDEEFIGMDSLLELLEAIVEDELDCKIIRSKLETSDEIAYKGEWEDDKE